MDSNNPVNSKSQDGGSEPTSPLRKRRRKPAAPQRFRCRAEAVGVKGEIGESQSQSRDLKREPEGGSVACSLSSPSPEDVLSLTSDLTGRQVPENLEELSSTVDEEGGIPDKEAESLILSNEPLEMCDESNEHEDVLKDSSTEESVVLGNDVLLNCSVYFVLPASSCQPTVICDNSLTKVEPGDIQGPVIVSAYSLAPGCNTEEGRISYLEQNRDNGGCEESEEKFGNILSILVENAGSATETPSEGAGSLQQSVDNYCGSMETLEYNQEVTLQQLANDSGRNTYKPESIESCGHPPEESATSTDASEQLAEECGKDLEQLERNSVNQLGEAPTSFDQLPKCDECVEYFYSSEDLEHHNMRYHVEEPLIELVSLDSETSDEGEDSQGTPEPYPPLLTAAPKRRRKSPQYTDNVENTTGETTASKNLAQSGQCESPLDIPIAKRKMKRSTASTMKFDEEVCSYCGNVFQNVEAHIQRTHEKRDAGVTELTTMPNGERVKWRVI